MESTNSLDEYILIASVLDDLHKSFQDTFTARDLRLTKSKVKSRMMMEGVGFLTKTLPRLGKALDRALSSQNPIELTGLSFDTEPGVNYPRFLGEFFSRVLNVDGTLLPGACPLCVKSLRLVLYLFYKYKLPYDSQQEDEVIAAFKKTEDDLVSHTYSLWWINHLSKSSYRGRNSSRKEEVDAPAVARRARILLERALCDFDPTDIVPKHGPGVVATKQVLWEKFKFTNVSKDITDLYPFDAYYCASAGHVCDSFRTFSNVTDKKLPAKVILVPKDSRGPRLISCEPVDYQWIQQGLAQGLVRHVERHPLTRYCVYFTKQWPNQKGAILGSITGRYATLDLKEASDRVSVSLVHLLFPERLHAYLDACRTCETVLPNGDIMTLLKYAPMGSALCFPILALTIWSIVTAVAYCTKWDGSEQFEPDQIHVYGDDVIVPSALALKAITALESFGLLVNRDKSCLGGFFRESCGKDSFKGVDVTPVRFRTVLDSRPSPATYSSWIDYSNSCYDRGLYTTHERIVSWLISIYGAIPEVGQIPKGSAPALKWDCTLTCSKLRKRRNRRLQRLEHRVLVPTTPPIRRVIDGWLMLLRYFTESKARYPSRLDATDDWDIPEEEIPESQRWEEFVLLPFDAGSYTKRHASLLVYRWR